MAAILSLETFDSEKFLSSAVAIGFDEFVAKKYVFTMYSSDLDVYQLIGEERASLIIYGLKMCRIFLKNQKNQKNQDPNDNLLLVIKSLTYHSLELMFSKDWERVKLLKKVALKRLIEEVKSVIETFVELSVLNWNYVLNTLGTNKWNILYTDDIERSITEDSTANKDKESIETSEVPATDEDICFLRQEGIVLVVHRLIKKFDAGELNFVKAMVMRMLAAWNCRYEETQSFEESGAVSEPYLVMHSLLVMSHLFLMVVYEEDNVRGYAIDNMIRNTRFYAELGVKFCKDTVYTPAQYIAITLARLGLTGKEVLEDFIRDEMTMHRSTLFGLICPAYKSYLLGSLLMEINVMSDVDYNLHRDLYASYMDLYVKMREESELSVFREVDNTKAQRWSRKTVKTVPNMSNFRDKICKGNRLNNLESLPDDLNDYKENKEAPSKPGIRYCDTIFENVPNDLVILKYTYGLLAKSNYEGWRLAKIYLLVKIINLEFNEIEKWRHHEGATIDFMLDLDKGLSPFYADMARLFHDKLFIEQEYWLTAFYLDPIKELYTSVMRCGMRSHKRRQNMTALVENPKSKPKDCAKYGLLSSTTEVTEISNMTNYENPHDDYANLDHLLRSLRLPEMLTKDLLTIMCLPRNKSFAWAVQWPELRKQCKDLMKNPNIKRRLVRQTMADFIDDLKFLKIDYEKYRHRPQLNYGTIEEGFEGDLNPEDLEPSQDDYYEDDYDEEMVSDEENSESEDERKDAAAAVKALCDAEFSTTRRTRARTAAVIARLNEELQSKEAKTSSNEIDENRVRLYQNSTKGFKPFVDVWNPKTMPETLICDHGFLEPMCFPDLMDKIDKLRALKREQGMPVTSSEEEESGEETDREEDEEAVRENESNEREEEEKYENMNEESAEANKEEETEVDTDKKAEKAEEIIEKIIRKTEVEVGVKAENDEKKKGVARLMEPMAVESVNKAHKETPQGNERDADKIPVTIRRQKSATRSPAKDAIDATDAIETPKIGTTAERQMDRTAAPGAATDTDIDTLKSQDDDYDSDSVTSGASVEAFDGSQNSSRAPSTISNFAEESENITNATELSEYKMAISAPVVYQDEDANAPDAYERKAINAIDRDVGAEIDSSDTINTINSIQAMNSGDTMVAVSATVDTSITLDASETAAASETIDASGADDAAVSLQTEEQDGEEVDIYDLIKVAETTTHIPNCKKLVKECLTRKSYVLLKRLMAADLVNLRQVRVQIKRLSGQDILEATSPKRKRVRKRSVRLCCDHCQHDHNQIRRHLMKQTTNRKPEIESFSIQKLEPDDAEDTDQKSLKRTKLAITSCSDSGMKLRITSKLVEGVSSSEPASDSSNSDQFTRSNKRRHTMYDRPFHQFEMVEVEHDPMAKHKFTAEPTI